MELPKIIQPDQLISLVSVLATKITGASATDIRRINSDLNEKVIEAALFVGFIKVVNGNYTVSEIGKKYSQANDQTEKTEALIELLKNVNIYNLTIEYFYHNQKENPTKFDVGTYWTENFPDFTSDLTEDDITGVIVFFFRFLELASLGKYIQAGRGRETHIKLDTVELAKYITSNSPKKESISKPKQEISDEPKPIIETEISQEENEIGSLNILKKLNPELVWSDLDSNGAKKLIIDKINVLSNENIVLSAKVDKYQKMEGINAVLNEKVTTLKEDNLFRASVNSIGGVILGASLTNDELIFQITGCILGALLIILSVLLKSTKTTNNGDNDN